MEDEKKIILFVKCDNLDVDAVVPESLKAKWQLQLEAFYGHDVKLLVMSDLLTVADLTESELTNGYETR